MTHTTARYMAREAIDEALDMAEDAQTVHELDGQIMRAITQITQRRNVLLDQIADEWYAADCPPWLYKENQPERNR